MPARVGIRVTYLSSGKGLGLVLRVHMLQGHILYCCRGSKTFVLASPNATREKLHLFPFLHPSHAQCQKRLSVDSDAAAYVTTLVAGDVLYIPPLWAHEVRNEGDERDLITKASPHHTLALPST